MLDEISKAGLDKVLDVLKQLKVRFPNAEIEKGHGADPGNISAFLNGKKPISDKFFTIFLDKFPLPITKKSSVTGHVNTRFNKEGYVADINTTLKSALENTDSKDSSKQTIESVLVISKIYADVQLNFSEAQRNFSEAHVHLTDMLK